MNEAAKKTCNTESDNFEDPRDERRICNPKITNRTEFQLAECGRDFGGYPVAETDGMITYLCCWIWSRR